MKSRRHARCWRSGRGRLITISWWDAHVGSCGGPVWNAVFTAAMCADSLSVIKNSIPSQDRTLGNGVERVCNRSRTLYNLDQIISFYQEWWVREGGGASLAGKERPSARGPCGLTRYVVTDLPYWCSPSFRSFMVTEGDSVQVRAVHAYGFAFHAPQEDKLLRKLVDRLGMRSWKRIAKAFAKKSPKKIPRTGKSCRLRWAIPSVHEPFIDPYTLEAVQISMSSL